MHVFATASEKGGVGKTSVTVGLAKAFADRGFRVGLVDLDPGANLTDWLNVEPEAGAHVGAILANDDVAGLAEELALVSPWHPEMHVIPAASELAALETVRQDYAETRLRASLTSWDRDIVLIDEPNRQGGILVVSALTAADKIIYAATPDRAGITGLAKAAYNTERFRRFSPLNPGVEDAGVVVTRWPDPIATRDAKASLEAMRVEHPTIPLLGPTIPERVIVKESSAAGEWWGNYRKGQTISAAFRTISTTLIPATAQEKS